MTFAIIGLGTWGKKLLIEFNKIVVVSHCYTLGNRKNIYWLKKNFPKIKHTTSINLLLNDKEIDTIIIATPIKFHYDLTLAALKAGKNVFVEKPLATNSEQCLTLLKLAKKENLTLFVGHIFLYHPILLKIQKLIQHDLILYMHCIWEKCGSFNENISLNLLLHQILIMITLIGFPQKISASIPTSQFSKENIIQLDSVFSKNQQCRIQINRISNIQRMSVTIFTKKEVYLWSDNDLFRFNKQKKRFIKIFSSKLTPLRIECEEFFKSLKEKKKSYKNPEFAYESIKLLEQAKVI